MLSGATSSKKTLLGFGSGTVATALSFRPKGQRRSVNFACCSGGPCVWWIGGVAAGFARLDGGLYGVVLREHPLGCGYPYDLCSEIFLGISIDLLGSNAAVLHSSLATSWQLTAMAMVTTRLASINGMCGRLGGNISCWNSGP